MEFEKKGNHVLVISDTKDKNGNHKEYRITPLECSHARGTDDMPLVHWLCSCPDFMVGRIARGINPLDDPCKHIREFLSREVMALSQRS